MPQPNSFAACLASVILFQNEASSLAQWFMRVMRRYEDADRERPGADQKITAARIITRTSRTSSET
jgi:hypothetical protein